MSSVIILDPGNFTPYYDVNLSSALLAHGWNVEWLTSPYLFETIDAPANLRVKYLFFGWLNSMGRRVPGIQQMPWARRTIKALSYPIDLFHLDRHLALRAPGLLHVQWALFPALDARYWQHWQRNGWKIIYTAHDVTGLAGTTPRLLRNANRQLFRIADAVVAHSRADCERIIKLGISPSRVWHIPHGGPGIFANSKPTPSAARVALDITPNRPTILFLGLLKPYKGLDILIQSLAPVRQKIPAVLLMIIGEAMMNRKQLEQMIARHNLCDNVYWQPSYAPSWQIGLYFAAADVVALPYLNASSSAVMLNAFAHGKPVVSTDVGGLGEVVGRNEHGLIVPPSDAGALADALIELLRDPARRRAMGERAHRYVETEHSWASIASRTEELYNRLLK